MVAVVWVPPTPTPPCNAHGTVYERVSGKTESVREPLRLAQLFDRGDGARKRAEALASQIAQDAISAFGSRNHSEWADRVLFGVGVAAAGYEPDIGSRLFTQRFWHDVEKLVPHPTRAHPTEGRLSRASPGCRGWFDWRTPAAP